MDGKWSNREPRGVIRPGCPAIKCPKIFDPLQTLTECIRSDYSGIQAGGGGSRQDSNGPGRISTHTSHARLLECKHCMVSAGHMHAWEVVHAQEVCMGGMPGRHAGRGPGAAHLHA